MKNEDVNKIYGESLRAIRKSNNYTQEEAAQLTKLEAKYISKIERGIAAGTINTMLKFCNAYKITPNDILYKLIKKSNGKKELDEFNEKIMKLSKRDRKNIMNLIDSMLEN